MAQSPAEVIYTRIAAENAMAIGLWHHVVGQRQILGITIEQSLRSYMKMFMIPDQDYEGVRSRYYRMVDLLSPAFDHAANKCIECPRPLK